MDLLGKTDIELFESIKSALGELGFHVSDFKQIDYGVQLAVTVRGKKGVIRIYRSKKKGIKYDLSQIKDNDLKDELTEALGATSKTDNNTGKVVEEGFVPLIGTDESGKGDFFGPLVAAGVFVDLDTKKILEKSGVRDSKKISDDKIMILADLIKKVCFEKYAVIEIPPETYNNLYEQFKSEKKNLNTLLAWAHAKAIEEVLGKVDCTEALSDKFGDEKFILNKLQEKGKKINLRQETKAESNIAVAAASVLARARFLERMKKLSIEFQMDLAKGASELVISQARKLIELNGKDVLRRLAKLHFKTTEQL